MAGRFKSCCWCFIILLSLSANAAIPRGSIGRHRRAVAKENKHDSLDTFSPSAQPTVLVTVDPSIEWISLPSASPTRVPTRKQTEAPVQLPTQLPTLKPNTLNPTVTLDVEPPATRSLAPFAFEFRNSLTDESVLDELVERYLFVSLKSMIATVLDVELKAVDTNRKLRGLEAGTIRMYNGFVTIGDESVIGPVIRTAQTAVLEDTASVKQFFANSDIGVIRVQVGDRDPVSIPIEKENEQIAGSAPNVLLIAPVSIAVLFIVIASIMLIRYRRNKAPAPPPYFFEDDDSDTSSISLNEIERFGKSRTVETETEQISPSERPSLRKLSSSRFVIQECLAGGGMEVVQLDSDGEDAMVQLSYVPTMSPSRSLGVRSHSPNSMSVFSNSNDSTALKSSAMRCGRSRTVDSHIDNSSAQLTLDSTKALAAFSMLASSCPSYTDDSINDIGDSCLATMEERADDIFVRRNQSHSPNAEMHEITCTKSEETERRFNPPNKWLAPPRQPPVSPLDDLLHSDSSTMADASTMALESVLNPVRHSEQARSRVFVDSDSASINSEGKEEDYQGDSENDSLAPELLESVGSIHKSDSFGSEPSKQKKTPLSIMNETLQWRESKKKVEGPASEARIVSPTSSSHGNESDEENDAPSDEETRFMQMRNSFEYSEAGSMKSGRDVLEESTLFPTLNSTMDSISYSSSSVASQDSSSQFDPVFMEQLKWEKRRAKAATRKLQTDEKRISFDMDL